MPPRKRLGQLLTELKIIDEHQLQSALGHQKQWGGKLGYILVQKGFCKEEQVVTALSQHLALPAVRLSEAKIDPRAVKTVARSVAEKLHVFAYEVTGSGRSEVITIAMSDPTDLSAVDQLAFHTGKRIKPMLAGDSEVLAAIQQYYAPEKPKEEAAPSAPPGSRPLVTPLAATPVRGPGGAARATPAAPLTPVSPARPTPNLVQRVEPPGPYIPPPVPQNSKPQRRATGEIAGQDAGPHPGAPPDVPGNGAAAPLEPLGLDGGDLPPDAPVEGLEPIAAHTQGSQNVEGAEEVAGQGAASDDVEGLEAVNPRESIGDVEVQKMEALEPSIRPQEAQADLAPMEAPPLEDAAALQGWGEGQKEGVPLETENPAPAPPPAEGGWRMAPAEDSAPALAGWGESPADELPMDAIMGTAEVLEGAAPDVGVDVSAAVVQRHARQPEQAPQPEHAQEAPDAWSELADPLATATEPEAAEPALAAELTAPEHPAAPDPTLAELAAAALAAVESTAIPPDAWGSQEPGAAAWAESPESSSSRDDAPAPAGEAAPAETPAEDAWSEEEQRADAGEEPAGGRTLEEAAAAAADETGLDDTPVPAEEPPPAYEAEAEYAEPSYGEAGGELPAEEPSMEPPAAESTAPQSWPQEQAGELQEGGQVSDERQPMGWLGDALASTSPLSPADLGTLAALGIDPEDNVGALRLVACMVRVLNRSQAIDIDELNAELRESRIAGAAAVQAAAEQELPPEPEQAETAAEQPGSEQGTWAGSHES